MSSHDYIQDVASGVNECDHVGSAGIRVFAIGLYLFVEAYLLPLKHLEDFFTQDADDLPPVLPTEHPAFQSAGCDDPSLPSAIYIFRA